MTPQLPRPGVIHGFQFAHGHDFLSVPEAEDKVLIQQGSPQILNSNFTFDIPMMFPQILVGQSQEFGFWVPEHCDCSEDWEGPLGDCHPRGEQSSRCGYWASNLLTSLKQVTSEHCSSSAAIAAILSTLLKPPLLPSIFWSLAVTSPTFWWTKRQLGDFYPRFILRKAWTTICRISCISDGFSQKYWL